MDRSEYLIDRFRVRYAFGGGWTCSCADFVSNNACKHSREAAGRRAAQAQIARHLKMGSAYPFTLHHFRLSAVTARDGRAEPARIARS
jgi:hypothetical protein